MSDKKTEMTAGIPARTVAVRVLMAVLLKGRPFEAAFDELSAGAKLEPRDRAFALELVMTVLRRKGSLTHVMDGLLSKGGLPFEATWTRHALLVALAQLLILDTPAHAAVDQTVGLIKNLNGKEAGFAPLVNAVLRRAVREKDDWVAALNVAPELDVADWLRESWTEAYGREAVAAIGLSLRSVPPLDISLKDAADKVVWAEKLQATLMPTGTLRRGLTDVRALPGFETGDWWVQDMAAAIPATLLGDVSGKHVLDLCAAPGGKTMQLAARGAHVTAVDRNKNRLKRLAENIARVRLEERVEIEAEDAASYVPAVAAADAILVDAPCSATGTLRRNPDVMWTKGRADVEKLADLQARILDHAFSLLPAGGRMVYCVCSLEPSEGIDQIEAFLVRTPEARREALTVDDVGGISAFVTEKGDLLTLPSMQADEGGVDGFYAARIIRA